MPQEKVTLSPCRRAASWQSLNNAVEHLYGLLFVGIKQNHAKLFATVAANGVLAA